MRCLCFRPSRRGPLVWGHIGLNRDRIGIKSFKNSPISKQNLTKLAKYIFLLTPETDMMSVEMIVDRAGRPKGVADAIGLPTSCGAGWQTGWWTLLSATSWQRQQEPGMDRRSCCLYATASTWTLSPTTPECSGHWVALTCCKTKWWAPRGGMSGQQQQERIHVTERQWWRSIGAVITFIITKVVLARDHTSRRSIDIA